MQATLDEALKTFIVDGTTLEIPVSNMTMFSIREPLSIALDKRKPQQRSKLSTVIFSTFFYWS